MTPMTLYAAMSAGERTVVLGKRWTVLLAAAAAVLGSACSGSGTDPRAVASPEAAVGDAAPADGLGESNSAPAANLERESREQVATPSDNGDTDDGTDGAPDAEPDDGFTPYEQRVSPVGAFIADLVDEVYDYRDYPDPMAAIEDMKFDCMTA